MHRCLLALALVLGGCATTTQSQSDTGRRQVAKLGDAIRLKGNESTMRVRVLRVRDVAGGEFDKPARGKRYVGVELSLQNVGQGTYKDSPLNGAHIVTADDEQADPTLVSGGACGGSFSTDTTIAPGAKRRGCIPFEVPKRGRVKTFQFALDSGFGPQSGEWKLR